MPEIVSDTLALYPGRSISEFLDPGLWELYHKVSEGPVYATPVVSGNRIFVKDQESVTLWTVE